MADYKVLVELALVGNMASALAAITAHMVGIQKHQKEIAAGFASWRAALAPVAAIFVGGAIIGGVASIAMAASKATDQLKKMEMQGQSAADVAENWKKAVDVSLITGRPIAETLSEMGKMAYIAGKPEEARELSLKLAQIETIFQGISGKTGEGQAMPILKMLEEAQLLGNPVRQEDLAKAMEWITKDIVATSGAVSPQQMMGTYLNARAARYGWASPEALAEPAPFMFTTLPYLIQKYAGGGAGGGTRGPGAALMSSFTKVVQGIMSKSSMEEAEKLGLLTGGHMTTPKFAHGKFGKAHFVGGETLGSDLFQQNPYEWAQRVMWPHLKAHGITQQADIIRAITKYAGTRAAADPIIDMVLSGRARWRDMFGGGQFAPAERHIAATKRAMGIHEAFLKTLEMPTVALRRLGIEFENLFAIIGRPLSPVFASVLNTITDTIKGVATWANTVDPDTIRGIGGALTGLGAGLLALGSAALIGGLVTLAGPGGLLFALGATIAAMSPKVHAAVKELGEAVSKGNMDKIKQAGYNLAVSIVTSIVMGIGEAQQFAIDKAKELGRKMVYGSAEPQTPFQQFHRRRMKDQLPTIEPAPLIPPSFNPFSIPSMPALPQSNVMPALPPTGTGMLGMAPSTTSPLLRKAGWEPGGGGGGGGSTINNVIYLDGAAIARTVHSYGESDAMFPRQASQFDGRAGYTSPDWQPLGI